MYISNYKINNYYFELLSFVIKGIRKEERGIDQK